MQKKQVYIKTILAGLALTGISVGADAQSIGDNMNTNTGTHASAIGSNCSAAGTYSIAGGYQSSTGSAAYSSIALGEECSSTGGKAVSLGWKSSALGNGSVGIGYRAKSTGSYSVSIGTWADATNTNSISIGKYVKSSNSKSFVIGTGAHIGSRLENNIANSLMIGLGSTKPTLFVTEADSNHGVGQVRIGGLATNTLFNNSGRFQVVDQSSSWNAFIFNGGGGGKGLRVKAGFYNGGHSIFQVEANNSAGSSLAEGSVRFSVKADGRVIIGNPSLATEGSGGSAQISKNDYRLFVEKGILAEKVKVALANSADWADYVFEKDYKLKTLSEVEAFIKKNKHLPDVPSAEKVVEEGIDVAKMNALLLQKIEELTLYVIELEKKYEAISESK